MNEMAERLAELLNAYGELGQGTWQQRKEALVSAINAIGGSGAGEVLGWFGADTECID